MRIACVQTDVVFDDPAANAARAVEHLERLAAGGVQLVVFPEAYLTGYCVESAVEASCIAIPSPLHVDGRAGEVWTALQQAADRLDVHVVLGFAERISGDLGRDAPATVAGDSLGKVANTAALITPNEPARVYRKTHLPELGLDHFVTPGDQLSVFETRLGKIGILICFDIRAPEAARALALQGADVIVLPTNWPTGAQVSAEVLAAARAVENKVFVATCNRVGTENGFSFIGLSKIIDPSGKVLAAASGDEEVALVADLDLELARNKRNVTVAGKHETTVFESRRPDLYGELTKS